MTAPATNNAASLNQDADALTSRRRKPSEGVWKGGHWWCNCEPRKKAHILEVKKPNSPHKGRFFWRCAHHPFCNFFLWIDEARVRQAALESAPDSGRPGTKGGLSSATASAQMRSGFMQQSLTHFGFTNKANAHHAADQVREDPRSEEAAIETASDSSGADREEQGLDGDLGMGNPAAQKPSSPPGGKEKGQVAALVTPGNANKGKRKRDALSDDDSDGFESLDSDEERQLTELTDRTVRDSVSKSATQDGATPGEGSTLVGGLATPSIARTLFPQPGGSKRQKGASFQDTPSSKTMSADSVTPSTAGKTERGTPNTASSVEDIAEEIMALLENQGLDTSARDQVKDLLKKASTRTRMVAMGRDAARSALRDRDIKIGRMQERMADLENKQRMELERVSKIKFGIMKVYDDN